MTRAQGLLMVVLAVVYMAIVGAGVHDIDKARSDRLLKAVTEQADVDHQNDLMRINDLQTELEIARRDNEGLLKDKKLLSNQINNVIREARASRSRQVEIGSVSWAHSVHGIQIANCESADLQHWPYSDGSRYLGGEKGIHLHDQAIYTGKWQIGPNEWRDWGGLQYASAPYLATEFEQDLVAERGHDARGEQPWDCARRV